MLLFYKDELSAPQFGITASSIKPQLSLSLDGTVIKWGSNESSRKNIFQLSTVFGTQLLIQAEDQIETGQWYEAVGSAISQLVLPEKVQPEKEVSVFGSWFKSQTEEEQKSTGQTESGKSHDLNLQTESFAESLNSSKNRNQHCG
ncbi:rho GTPase-activating protein 12-like [Artemia franciscana]|uniref:rho GTPase-activating protein 12-like n=1 Tax=Artemia franciscana TaxID=6661 RepID=UPI0032DB3E21